SAAHTRHLARVHSSPTRRSSDLSGPLATAAKLSLAQLAREDVLLPRTRPPGSLWAQVSAKLPGRARVDDLDDLPAALDLVAAGQDRKSTRLNSSHVKISYAVFCV